MSESDALSARAASPATGDRHSIHAQVSAVSHGCCWGEGETLFGDHAGRDTWIWYQFLSNWSAAPWVVRPAARPSKSADLGALWNSVAGAIGGLGGGSIIAALGGAAGGAAGGLDVASIATQLLGSGLGGVVLQAIVGLLKNSIVGK